MEAKPNMPDLSQEKQIESVRKLMHRNIWINSQIYFLLPSDLSKSFYTKAEYDYLIEDPRRLRQGERRRRAGRRGGGGRR